MESDQQQQDKHTRRWYEKLQYAVLFGLAAGAGAFVVYKYGKKCAEGDACYAKPITKQIAGPVTPVSSTMNTPSFPTTPETPGTVQYMRSIDQLAQRFQA
uniref:Uncharacterized protein n=1 Tax=Clandestinovirus TaxID=2831644 RepID=A0A8F8KP15_9VIRU|nr:hypothetical protein KOM_12_403 [Clandestinovirus]